MTLGLYREKWREAPQGSDADGRIFSTDLLALPDDDFLARWETMAARRYGGELGWLGPLYAPTFRGGNVLELGSGLGFDGLRFAQLGAHWTFADIVPDNLQVIRRVAALKGLDSRISLFLIGDDLSFEALAGPFDAIWVFGSIHHVPFDVARREAQSALTRLKPDGRWMELVYPRERWLREGSLPFTEWGRVTDGERTPWAEWHDAEKIRSRLAPAAMRTVLDFGFCSDNYRWVDLQRVGTDDSLAPSIDLMATGKIEGGRRLLLDGDTIISPAGLFAESGRMDLSSALASMGDDIALDLDVKVSRGSIGIGLVDANDAYLPGAEVVLNASDDAHRATLRATGVGRAAALVFRNLYSGERGTFTVRAATLRATVARKP
jgi:SAM-dependent methyltransferase